MTFNWGHKLILAFLAFGGLMGILVVRSMQTNFELVTKDYYKEELQYQQVIDGTNRANALSRAVQIQQQGDSLAITFPDEMKGLALQGKIWFYCKYNEQYDRHVALNNVQQGIQTISLASFHPARYTARISWQVDGEHYYSEQPITIQ